MAIVSALICALLVTVTRLHIVSYGTLVGMIVIPFGVAYLCHRISVRSGWWPLTGLFLLAWAWVSAAMTASFFGIGS